jgi:hypothetical protein
VNTIRISGLVVATILWWTASGAAQASSDISRQYAKYLSQLQEPDLASSGDTAETYRALWLRSFHEAVSVRIYRRRDTYTVITVQGTRHDSSTFPPGTWNTLHLRDAMKRFWTTKPIPLPRGQDGLDGARWILEGRHGGRYHAVDWWSPSQSAPGIEGGYGRLFLEILSIGTVRVSPDAVY